MRMSVRASGSKVSAATRSRAEHRLLFALARFEERIQDVNVLLTNLDAGGGGIESSCRISARLVPWGGVAVEEANHDLHAAIDRGANRLRQSVAHELNRRRHLGVSERVGVNGGR